MLQARIEQMMPGTAALVEVLYQVELAYRGQQNAGAFKKKVALQRAKALT